MIALIAQYQSFKLVFCVCCCLIITSDMFVTPPQREEGADDGPGFSLGHTPELDTFCRGGRGYFGSRVRFRWSRFACMRNISVLLWRSAGGSVLGEVVSGIHV